MKKSDNTLFISQKKATFLYYSTAWLQLNKRGIKESTYIKYRTILDKHIHPILGNYGIDEITSDMIGEFTAQLLKKLSPVSVKTILVITNAVLTYARSCDQITENPVVMVYPKVEKKEMRILSSEEQNRFVKYLLKDMDCCKFGVLLTLLTGMRIGELCALKWNDIDFQTKTLHIRHTMQRLQNLNEDFDSKTRICIGSPKTATSLRVIPLTDPLIELCRKFREEHSDTYILTSAASYMEPRTLQYRMRKYMKDCGLEGVHFHTLRHTFATRCVEVGFEIKSLSEILGHANTSITLNQYVHSSLEWKRSNMNKLSIL